MSGPRHGLFALVLAAGGSRRLGSPKQLLKIGGETLIRRTLQRASAVCGGRTIAVLGCEWRAVLRDAADSVGFFTLNEAWQTGLASSLTLGVRTVPDDCRAVLVLLADQPLVDRSDLETLVIAWCRSPSRIAASRYGDILGPPAIFPRAFFPELLELTGDRGARPVLERHRDTLTIVDCEHAALDIDTPDDVAALAARSTGED
jgi:molybdenum cofactor cytidylyltransferase